MWLLGRLVYRAENKRAVVPGLPKRLGARPWSSAWGWSTFGSRAGGGTLLRNAPPSIAFCLGLVWPRDGVGGDAAAFSCALLPPCCLHPAQQGRGLCSHPKRRPHPPRPLARMRLANFITSPVWG